jgi:DNA-binding IclR family transcriptional regulator
MKSLNKTLDILEVFLNLEGNDIRFSELVKLSALNKGTVNRIISVLVDRGYLYQSEKRGKYSLGTKFLNFTRIIKRGMKIRDIAMPHLAKLGNSVGECVILANRYGGEAFIGEVVESKDLLRTSPDVGTEIPLYCTGLGKAILASMPEQELEQYLKNVNIREYTENTITDLNQLRINLMVIAKEGVAYDDEEQHLGIRNVAAAIKDADGKVCAAIGVLGPSLRLTRAKMREITPEVKLCALAISRALGYRGDNLDAVKNRLKAKKQRVAIA